MTRLSTADFYDSKTTLYDAIVLDICQTFVETHRIYNTKSEF